MSHYAPIMGPSFEIGAEREFCINFKVLFMFSFGCGIIQQLVNA